MKRLFTLLFLCFAVGCGSNNKKTYNYKNHPFDAQVIARLPLYDSISQVLLQNFAALKDEMKDHSSFDFGRSKTAILVNPALPADAAEKINHYMKQLGDDYLTEFSVYKDSSIKYSVRDTDLKGYDITARERLSYLPNGGTMQRREPPNKDTILNSKWQYWIRFDDKGPF
jgi:hypothetical protein